MSDPPQRREPVEIAVLGPLEVRRNGRAVALGSPQQRAVLARLACSANQVVTTDQLIDALWGEHPSPGVLTSLQTHVFHLRQALEPGRRRGEPPAVLLRQGPGYRLAIEPETVDATRFERLVARAQASPDPGVALRLLDEGLALWRGEILVDLPAHPFVAGLATRLEDLRIGAREARVRALLALGRDAEALGDAQRLAAEHPLHESAQAQRMTALYRNGRQSDALAAYREVRQLLDEELGVEPGPQLQALHSRMLAHGPTLDPVASVASTSATRPARAAPGAAATFAAVPAAPAAPATFEGTRSGAAAAIPGVSAPVKDVPPAVPPTDVDGHRPGRRSRWHPSAWTVRGTRRLLGGAVAVAVLAAAALATQVPRDAVEVLASNSVGLLDGSGHLLDGIDVGASPSALGVVGGAVWVATESDNVVERVDPATHRVTQRIPVGATPAALASTGDDLWVANFGDGTVSRVSTSAQRVVETVTVGKNPGALAAGAGFLWVANSADNTVQRIDARTGRTGPAVGVGDGPDGLLLDGGSLWVANGRDGTVSHVDAATGAELDSPVQVGSGPRGLVRLGPEVWVADELSQSVTRIDVASLRTRAVYVADGPTSLAVLDGAVWVTERYAGSVARIDASGESTTRYAVGAAPRAAVASGGRLWVAAGAAGSSEHRGGTLTVAAVDLPGSYVETDLPGAYSGIDPAFVYDIPTFQAERVVYEGLVAVRYSTTDPQTVVPALATRVPRPSDGGRTYTFQLRAGVRYSTGAPVVASDLRRGLERVVEVGPATLYSHVIGVPECLRHKGSCLLPAGVTTDDATGRVSLHLSSPDPDLLFKLGALVYPLPAGFRPGVTGPRPGTGPYAVAEYAAGTAYVLRRNPWFTERSRAASPDGYPDEIRWLKAGDQRAVAAAVLDGRADLGTLTPIGARDGTGALVSQLRLSHPARLHSENALSTSAVVLDASRPPFDRLAARQALSYAIDRRVLAEVDGGPLVARPSCQLLPPGFPAYQPFCPYTTSPHDGSYHGPDLARARALVAASGTKGARVTVVDVVGDYYPAYQDYLVTVLRSLGYHVALRRLPDTAANEAYLDDADSHVQVRTGGWIPDYPGVATFYDAFVRCGAAYATGYCNPALDGRADAALAAQRTDPGAALRAWTSLDHDAAQQLPVVFGTSAISWWVTSSRVGNYQSSPYLGGPLLSQLWVR